MNFNGEPHGLYSDWLNLQLHLLWCYDHKAETGPGGTTRPIYWACNSAWLVRSGFAQVERKGMTYRATAGEWLIVPKGTFARSFADSTHLLSVGYNAQWPDGQLLFDDGLPLVIKASEHPDLEITASRLTGLAAMPTSKWDTRKQPVSCRTFLRLNAEAGDWFVTLLDILAMHSVHPHSRQKMDPRVLNAIRILDGHPLHTPFDQDSIAVKAGLSLVHLVRLFRRDLHTTPKDYFEGRRFEQAVKLLSLPNASPKQIAYDLGFKHLSHFSTWFKKTNGTPPRNYIRTVNS
jgi:AraC-like DNA-binding protein